MILQTLLVGIQNCVSKPQMSSIHICARISLVRTVVTCTWRDLASPCHLRDFLQSMADPTRAALVKNASWKSPSLGSPSSSLYQLPPMYPLAVQMFPYSGVPNVPVTSQSGSEEVSRADSTLSSPGGPTSGDTSPSSAPNVKRVRFVLSKKTKPAEEPIETPAMRLKARPKRPNLHAVQTDSTPDDDDDDEDYVAPRSFSNSSSKKHRERNRSHPLAAFSSPRHHHQLPTNAYPVLGTEIAFALLRN